LAHGPEENSGRAGFMAGFGAVVIAMSPILTDGQRPVGRAWPAAVSTGSRVRHQLNFVGAVSDHLKGVGNLLR
jgi:hypothetical protein